MKKPSKGGKYSAPTEIIIYESADGKPQISVRVENETVWLTQAQLAELFSVQRPAITKHLKNIFESGELEANSVSSILEHTAGDGKNTDPRGGSLPEHPQNRTETGRGNPCGCPIKG